MHMERHFELPPPNGGKTDRVTLIEKVSFDQFLAVARQRDREGRRGLRLHYLEGSLELMATGEPHEWHKATLARCLLAWSELAGVELHSWGSPTMHKRATHRGAQPDDCYYVGPRGHRRFPDLVIE